jgi:hypothetical protein
MGKRQCEGGGDGGARRFGAPLGDGSARIEETQGRCWTLGPRSSVGPDGRREGGARSSERKTTYQFFLVSSFSLVVEKRRRRLSGS